MNNKNRKPSRIKDWSTLLICWSLFFVDIGFIYAQADNVKVDQVQENQAVSNKSAHEASDKKFGLSSNTTKCDNPTSGDEDNRAAQRDSRNNLAEQGFSEIDQIFVDVEAKRAQLDGTTGNLNSATAGVNGADPAQTSNIAKHNALKKEEREIDGKIQTQRGVVTGIERKISSIENRNDERNYSSAEQAQLNLLRAQLFKEQAELQKLRTRKYQIKADINDNDVNGGNAALAKADKAVGKARVAAGSQEQNYRDLLALIKAQEAKADENVRIAEQRIREVQQEAEHNADYLIFSRAMQAPDENTEKGRNTIANLELLSMASSGMTNLTCRDFSRIKSRSYPLFKAATATYIANHLNSTSDYTRVAKGCILKCVSLEAIEADQKLAPAEKKYPQFENLNMKGVTSNCQTEDGKEGMFENDNVASDDEDEQYAAIERMANLYQKLAQFTEKKLDAQSQAIKLFSAAHAAAMMEVTSKNSLIAAAEAQLAKAEAEKKKAQSSILIIVAILAIYYAFNSTCPGCCGCMIGAIVVAVAALAMYRKDLAQANRDIAKWKKELQEARIHTHMMCNYPGENGDFNTLKNPGSVPLIYPKSRIMQQVTAQVDHEQFKNPHKVAGTIEWIRSMQGAISSLPFDQKIPSKTEMEGILHKLGLYLSHNKEKIGDKIAGVLFPSVQAVGLESGIGLHDQAGTFSHFLSMKMGAWRLQTHNAALKVDLRKSPVSIEHLYPNIPLGMAMSQGLGKFVQKNSPEVYGRLIEQTGFPIPETRVVYLATIVQKLKGNVEFMTQGLASVQDINNTYAKLLNESRKAMKVTKGATDADVDESGNQNVCLAGDSGGEISVDSNCACKSSGTCARFNMPSFGAFSAGDLATDSQFLVDGANSFANGDSVSGSNSFGKMGDSSSALNDLNKRFASSKLNLKGKNARNAFSRGGGFNKQAMVKKARFKSKSSSSTLDTKGSKNSKSLADSSDSEKDLDSDSDSKSKDSLANINGAQGVNAKALALAKANAQKLKKKRDAFNVNDIDLDGLDSENISDADIDLMALEEENKRSGNNSGDSSMQYDPRTGGGMSGGYYKGKDGKLYRNMKGISKNANMSIFKLLSKRYRRSAMPVLLNKKKKEGL